MTPGAPQVQLAMFHTFFNVTTVLVMMPLTEALVNLVVKMIPNSSVEEKEVNKLNFIDNNMLRTPPLAVVQTKREIIEMSKIAMENYDRAMHAITTLDLSEREVFDKTESRLNFINKELVNFVVKLTGERALSEKDHIYLLFVMWRELATMLLILWSMRIISLSCVKASLRMLAPRLPN